MLSWGVARCGAQGYLVFHDYFTFLFGQATWHEYEYAENGTDSFPYGRCYHSTALGRTTVTNHNNNERILK